MTDSKSVDLGSTPSRPAKYSNGRDIEKSRASRRRYYQRNKEAQYERTKRQKQSITEYIRSCKTECSLCGENHPATLQFHHKDPLAKEITIANIRSKGWGRRRIEQELAKCIVVCANCHAKIHWEQRHDGSGTIDGGMAQ